MKRVTLEPTDHATNARAYTFMYKFVWRSPQIVGRLGKSIRWRYLRCGRRLWLAQARLVCRRTMRFDTTSRIVDDPLPAALAGWKGVR